MDRLQRPVWYFAGFGLAGLISASALIIADDHHWIPRLAPFAWVGITFGFFIAICFWIYVGLQSIGKQALFICSCTVAYYLSVLVANVWDSHVPALNSLRWGNWGPGAEVFFVAGWVGGFVVLAAALLILLPQQAAWRVLLKAAGWSLVGGILGALGYVMERFSVEQPYRWLQVIGNASLFVIWQTGMALLLALAFRLEHGSSNARPVQDTLAGNTGVRPSYSSSALRVIFFATILILLAYFVQWDLRASMHHL